MWKTGRGGGGRSAHPIEYRLLHERVRPTNAAQGHTTVCGVRVWSAVTAADGGPRAVHDAAAAVSDEVIFRVKAEPG